MYLVLRYILFFFYTFFSEIIFSLCVLLLTYHKGKKHTLSVLLCCQTSRRFSRFYLPKLLLVGLLWVVAVTLASWQEYNELHDPTYYYRLDTTNFMVNL